MAIRLNAWRAGTRPAGGAAIEPFPSRIPRSAIGAARLLLGPIHMTTLIILLLVLFAIGSLPSWPYSRSWGYYPSSGLGLLVLVMLLLLFTGRI